ncbi:MAG: hypothetical protein ABEL04_01225 [Salinibacter sp.]|uniref:hypothetical protein n=1 Tax=Salinibacter sp. TaxID=2065818 RepID=UPI0035D50DB6
MSPKPPSFGGSRWGRLLVLALAGTLLLQSGPVQVLVQQARSVYTQQTCSRCAGGVCPRTPDGDCSCTHSEPAESGADGVVLKTCDRDRSEALAPVVPKWQSSGTTDAPSPRVISTRLPHLYQSLLPQRLGDEIFRPPRTTPSVRLT